MDVLTESGNILTEVFLLRRLQITVNALRDRGDEGTLILSSWSGTWVASPSDRSSASFSRLRPGIQGYPAFVPSSGINSASGVDYRTLGSVEILYAC